MNQENKIEEIETAQGKSVITIRKDSLWKYSTFILAALLIVGAFIFFSKNNAPSANVVNTNAQQLPSQQGRVEIPISDKDPKIGESDAPVKIIEFSDFSCPFCAAASGASPDMVAAMKQNSPGWESPVAGIMRDYVEKGQVLFIYKFSYGHSGGRPASLVGWCLNEQKLFWKFHDQAFAHQSDVEDLEKMKALAQSVGADMGKLNSCLNSRKYDSKFDEDSKAGQDAGVRGTPAFFVNGKLIEGAVPYAQIKQALEAELN